MDCRDFRNRHLAFLDQTLSDAELVSMQRHLAECACCARHDTAVRRGLLIFRNLPPVEPSADFAARLNARLSEYRRADARAAAFRGPGVGTFAAAAAGVLTAGLVAISAFNWTEPARDLALPPVVATVPEPPPPPIVDQTVVTSASAGMPVWPAALIAEQAPVHFLSAEPQLARWSR